MAALGFFIGGNMSRSTKEILMNSTDRVEAQRKAMFNSLMDAVFDAGGDRQALFDYVVYQQITVLQLIDILAQNGIRFQYVKED